MLFEYGRLMVELLKNMKKVEIFTDGACSGNPGPGGWGVLLRYNGQEKVLNGAEPDTTNNRMELLAVIRALEQLKEPCDIDLTTDSQYVKKGITEWLIAWKNRNWHTAGKKPVKNIDLWQRLEELAVKHKINWHWVRGHNGHRENEIVDELARSAIEKLLKK